MKLALNNLQRLTCHRKKQTDKQRKLKNNSDITSTVDVITSYLASG